jgi:hypothetical protein
MAASAGTMQFGSSKGTLSVDLYLPDAAATLVTFNPSGAAAATSATTWRAPIDCVLQSIALSAAAPTATGCVITVNGAVCAGGTVKWANQLSTLANRMLYAIPIKAGDFVGATQF